MFKKLKDCGIGGKLGRWIYSFLVKREQTVIVNGQASNPTKVTSGVPQGSVLGPLLFLLGYIDKDLAYTILLSFADDTRLTKGISDVVEANQLQTDLNTIFDWADTNNMCFNNTKFEVQRYGQDSILKACTSYSTSTGEIIDEKSDIKDVFGKVRNISSWIL